MVLEVGLGHLFLNKNGISLSAYAKLIDPSTGSVVAGARSEKHTETNLNVDLAQPEGAKAVREAVNQALGNAVEECLYGLGLPF